MKTTVVLHNIRSTYNVGAILRTAEGFAVDEVVLSGYTPWPKKPGVLPYLAEKLRHQITKTAVGADEFVKTRWIENLPAWLGQQKALKIGLENNIADDRLVKLEDLQPEAEKVILVLGEEVNGIPPEILSRMDVLAEIPMYGRKESFNVSVAAGIALYALSLK